MAKIIKFVTTPHARGCGKLGRSYMGDRNRNGPAPAEEFGCFYKKMKHATTIEASNCTLRHLHRRS